MTTLADTCSNCTLWAMDSSTILSGKCTIVGVGRTKHRDTCLSHSNNQQKSFNGSQKPSTSTKTLN